MSRALRRDAQLDAAASAALATGVAAASAPSSGWTLATQPAWLDEYHTLFVAGNGTLAQSLRNLAHGADFNPPALHTIVRALGAIAGGVDTSGQHVLWLRLAFGSLMWLAMVCLYRLLRRRYDSMSSFAATFAVWAHPLVLQNTFELRFYGPWVLAAVLFVTALSADDARPLVRRLAIAASAIFLCLIHYFGVVSWALIALPFVVALRHQPIRRVVADIGAMAAGPAALAACLPILQGQRAALDVQTWIEPRSAGTTLLFLLLTPGWLLLLALVLRLAGWRRSTVSSREERPGGGTRDPAIFALYALGAIPLFLVAFSLLVQPAILDRYATVSILCCAPALAAALSRLGAGARIIAIACFLAIASLSARIAVSRERGTGASLQEHLRILRDSVAHDDLVVVCSRRDLYPLAHATPPVAQRLVYPLLPDSMLTSVRAIAGHERDAARVHARLFGFPSTRNVEDLREHAEFVVIEADHSPCAHGPWFPGHAAVPIAGNVYRLTQVRQ